MARRRHVTNYEIIEIEYNGRTLTFREMDDKWTCSTLKLEAKSLTALKRKIDKLDGAARRVSVPVLHVSKYGYSSRGMGAPAQVVMIAKGEDWERMNYDERKEIIDPKQRRVPTVWIMVANGNQQERKKVRLDECAFPTESVRASLEEYRRLGKEIARLEKERDSVLDAIPRVTIDDIIERGAKEDDIDDEKGDVSTNS